MRQHLMFSDTQDILTKLHLAFPEFIGTDTQSSSGILQIDGDIVGRVWEIIKYAWGRDGIIYLNFSVYFHQAFIFSILEY